MDFINQRTVTSKIKFKGIGVHTGEISKVEIKPAEPNTGIVFVKLPENITIKATVGNLIGSKYSTIIGRNNVKIATIEHLMAAFYGLGIDNAIVYTNGSEIPIMDGSSKVFLNLMEKKIKELNEEKMWAKINEKIKFEIEDRYIEYVPTNHSLTIEYEIAYFNYPSLNQKIKYIHSLETFYCIANSKTFVRNEDMEDMKRLKLGKGIILDKNTRLVKKNSNGNFVTHKILDLLGDLYLLGAPLIGKIRCYKGGHLVHTEFVKDATKKVSFIKGSKVIGDV